MKMYNRLITILILTVLVSSCSKDEVNVLPESALDAYELSIVEYFKEIALGMEFGNASKITRKWTSKMKIFVGGSPSSAMLDELETVKSEIIALSTDGFTIEIVNDSLQSNFYIFFGSAGNFANIFPELTAPINANWGLFSLYWNSENQIYKGFMYVDIVRANAIEQKHLLREELTQALGLARDSPLYRESIFQSNWTTTTEYAALDRELIRLLYHPSMVIGLNDTKVEVVLKNILIGER